MSAHVGSSKNLKDLKDWALHAMPRLEKGLMSEGPLQTGKWQTTSVSVALVHLASPIKVFAHWALQGYLAHKPPPPPRTTIGP